MAKHDIFFNIPQRALGKTDVSNFKSNKKQETEQETGKRGQEPFCQTTGSR